MTTILKRIMLIDDDPIVNLVNQTLIRSISPDMEIYAFTSPEEALHGLSADNQKTLLLLDLNMPRFDGWDFLDAFSAMPDVVKEQLCIYVLSSSIDDKDKQRALNYVVVKDYLVKPLLKTVLVSAIQQYEKQQVDADQVPV